MKTGRGIRQSMDWIPEHTDLLGIAKTSQGARLKETWNELLSKTYTFRSQLGPHVLSRMREDVALIGSLWIHAKWSACTRN